jgi:hypothetical protein
MTSHIKYLSRLFEETDTVEEMNITGNLDGGLGQISTPFAFQDTPPSKSDKDKEKKNLEGPYKEKPIMSKINFEEKLYKRIISTLNELKYSEYRDDDTQPLRKKINSTITEINTKLKEVETMINHANRLKQESGSDQNIFWKSTLNKFGNIDERLIKLSNKIREFSK